MEQHRFETKAIRCQVKRAHREHSVPIYMTSSFVFDDAEQARALFADEIEGNIYTRFSNPNTSEFIEKLCLLEGTEDGVATASGMSAVFTALSSHLQSGDHVLASCALFGSTHQVLEKILPKWGITHTYAPTDSLESWESLCTEKTKMILVETPSNPGLAILDLKKLGQLAKAKNCLLAVDNCFATPYLQQPAQYGADLVIHSATKFIDGQGRSMGGAILGSKELIKEVRFFARHSGPALSPFNSWLLSKSLETLAVRMDRHCDHALELAHRLGEHPKVEKVIYPFLDHHPQSSIAKQQMRKGGGLVSFIVKGGLEAGRDFLNSLTMISHTANLGDSRTIATHPASTTHSKRSPEDQAKVGIFPGLIRVSVGLEHLEDVYQDIDQALNSSPHK